MRIQVLSDLHLEFASFSPGRTDAEVVVIAGDVEAGVGGIAWLKNAFPDQPVIYVPGNHEFYGGDRLEVMDALRAQAKGKNIHPLDNDVVTIGGVTFLGATLWTDFNLFGTPEISRAAALRGMADFGQIRGFQPEDAAKLCSETCKWLKEETSARESGALVVVTHHAPSLRSVPTKYKTDPVSPAFASNLEPLIELSRARLWIHGHIHQSVDYAIGETRVLSNPRGYPQEKKTSGFRDGLVISV